MQVLAQTEGRKLEMGAAVPQPAMSAVLSAVGCGVVGGGGGSLELQLENEQKWLIYGPATRTHEGARGEQTARTTNILLTARTTRSSRTVLS